LILRVSDESFIEQFDATMAKPCGSDIFEGLLGFVIIFFVAKIGIG